MKLHRSVRQPTRRGRLALAGTGALCVALVGAAGQVPAASAHDGMHHHRPAFRQVNLISDIAGMAKLTDPGVRNPWGIAFGTAEGQQTPLWVANQFSEGPTAPVTVYTGANGTSRIQKVILPNGAPLEVAASSPTGMVFNSTDAFKIRQDGVRTPARFIFTENFFSGETDPPAGQVTGWSNVPAPAMTTTAGSEKTVPAFYTGLAIVPATHRHGPWLLASDVVKGTVDIYNRRYEMKSRPRLFVDRRAMHAGLVPYNVMTLDDGRVYVAYASQEAPIGSVTVFNANGRLLDRLVVKDDRLQGAWGMAIAPHNWGRMSGALLVGNVDNGLIVAYNRHNGNRRGILRDEDGKKIVIPGLWGIQFGNGVIGTPRRLIFAAGIGDEPFENIYEHGLVGYIRPAPRMMH